VGKTALISGAGVAGSTLAYWLSRRGFAVTVVERAAGQRSSGNPVDVKGPAIAVAQQMGIMPQLRAARSRVSQMTFVNASGKKVARIGLGAFQGGAGDLEVEIPRAELASILLAAAGGGAEFLWGDTITALADHDEGVEVTFEASPARRFDIVVGADGLHSVVRRLTFGAESGFIRHMGMYVATLRIDEPFGSEREVIIYNTPGRAVSVHPTRGHAIAALIFRHSQVQDMDHRDTGRHKRLVAEVFSGAGWRVPELLGRVMDSDDLYFDAVSQVQLPRWWQRRVAVAGDAASCLSLFGDGSTLAMAGAYTLAHELAQWADSAEPLPEKAFARYEKAHRAVVAPKLNGYRLGAAMLLPATRAGILTRNTIARAMPALTAVSSLRRNRTPA
jgi:2-polyprenyl-6-methoxyphenol hydroxylase-like FAD-dependent oxidoreductase